MSLIDQALKKTQSSLNQQKANGPAQSENITRPTPTPTFKQRPRDPLQQKRLLRYQLKLPGFNKYLVISMLAFILLIVSAFLFHTSYARVGERYANFYGDLFLNRPTSTKMISALPPPTATTTVATTPPATAISTLSLDGTMEMQNERVALINDHLYHRGELISGYRITQIHYNDVVLQNPVTYQTITLTPNLAQ